MLLNGKIARMFSERARINSDSHRWKRQINKNGTIEPFINLEIYNLVARLLNLVPAPNNGTKGFWDTYFSD